jgi:hypothetical protein
VPEGYPNSQSPPAIADEFEDATVARLLDAIRELGAIKVMLGMTCLIEQDVEVNEGGCWNYDAASAPIWENGHADQR